MAKFDVLLPVRNGLPYLKAAIDSIVQQSEKDWRLLILDHGSTDGSLDMAARFAEIDSRIVVLRNPTAPDLSALLNFGIDHADCEILVRQDSDDISTPDRFAMLGAALTANPSMVAVGSNASVIDEEGKHIHAMRLPLKAQAVSAAALFCNPMAHPTVAFGFHGMQATGVRYGIDFSGKFAAEDRIEIFGAAQDYFLFGQLAVAGKCMNLISPLVKYRRHSGTVGKHKFLEQMTTSLRVSTYLARWIARENFLPNFDPAAFCNFGGVPFVVDRVNSDGEFALMKTHLEKYFGTSAELAREMRYRRVLSRRSMGSVVQRYLHFRARHAPVGDEWIAVRQLLLSLVGARKLQPLPGIHLPPRIS